MARRPSAALRFLVADPEVTNFTYDLANLDELAGVLDRLLELPRGTSAGFIRELQGDHALHASLAARLRTRRDRRSGALFGRRAGWYAVTRATKPRVVVETGVADGLGTSALLRALERNAAEGHSGRLYGLDILAEAGWVIPPDLAGDRLELITGPSTRSIAVIAGRAPVDLFIHDSDHRREYEMSEYEAVEGALSPGAVVLSDNAHVTDALEEWSRRRGRRYAFWREAPARHFYPGGGIGISLPGR